MKISSCGHDGMTHNPVSGLSSVEDEIIFGILLAVPGAIHSLMLMRSERIRGSRKNLRRDLVLDEARSSF